MFDRSAGFNRTQQTLNGGTDGYLPGFSIHTAFLCAKVFAKNTNTYLRHVSPTFTGITVFMLEFSLVCLETWFWISTGSAALFIKAQISMERRQISSLPVLKDCWSRTTHPQPLSFPFSPSLSLLCELDSVHPLPLVFGAGSGHSDEWTHDCWILAPNNASHI